MPHLAFAILYLGWNGFVSGLNVSESPWSARLPLLNDSAALCLAFSARESHSAALMQVRLGILEPAFFSLLQTTLPEFSTSAAAGVTRAARRAALQVRTIHIRHLDLCSGQFDTITKLGTAP